MRPVPVGLAPSLAAFLTELRSAVTQIQQPGQPSKLFSCTQANLPAANLFPDCTVVVEDKNTQAVSTLVGSTWTWLRADGSAI